MPFNILFGKRDDPSTLEVVPPVDHYRAGTERIEFHNLSRVFTVAVVFPAELGVSATQNPLFLAPGQNEWVQVGSKTPGTYCCTTYVVGDVCPTCKAQYPKQDGMFLFSKTSSDPPGEPIIILD
jgi:hypothetical protein